MPDDAQLSEEELVKRLADGDKVTDSAPRATDQSKRPAEGSPTANPPQ